MIEAVLIWHHDFSGGSVSRGSPWPTEASMWRLGTHRTTCMKWSMTTTPMQAACCGPTSHWTLTRSVIVLVASQRLVPDFHPHDGAELLSADQRMCHNEATVTPGFSSVWNNISSHCGADVLVFNCCQLSTGAPELWSCVKQTLVQID